MPLGQIMAPNGRTVTHPLRLRPVTRDTPSDADQLVRDLLAQGSEQGSGVFRECLHLS